jgi:hypothetical protein
MDYTICGGIVCCSPRNRHLAQGQSIPSHKSSKAAGGRGCTLGCRHLALGLSCLGAGAIPASWLPNQASGVCWQASFCWVMSRNPTVLGPDANLKPKTNTPGPGTRRTQTPTPLGPATDTSPTLLAHDNKGPTPKPSA